MNLKLAEGEVILKELVLESNLDGFMKLKEESLKVGNLIVKDRHKLSDFLLCIDEVFCNCISHAYKEKPGKIDVKFYFDEEYLKVSVKDYGVGIPEKYAEQTPELPDDLLAKSGRGLVIVEGLCEKLTIKRNENIGTEVIIYFKKEW